jgi:acyl dehydratase
VTAEFDLDRLGSASTGAVVVAAVDRSIAFAAAINDSDPAHRSGRAVPPMFAVVPIYSVLYAAVDRVTPEAYREQVVHRAHEIEFVRPIAIGARLQAVARPVGLHAVRSGTAVTVQITVSDEAGPCAEQFATAQVRGLVIEHDAGVVAPGQTEGRPTLENAPPREARTRVDADQTHRYAAASGDTMALHLDDEVARALGFPGVIAHGLWTMAATSVAAIATCCAGDADRLSRLAVRLAAPVFPGDVLTTGFSRLDGIGADYAFETRNRDGVPVVKDGRVRVRDAPLIA